MGKQLGSPLVSQVRLQGDGRADGDFSDEVADSMKHAGSAAARAAGFGEDQVAGSGGRWPGPPGGGRGGRQHQGGWLTAVWALSRQGQESSEVPQAVREACATAQSAAAAAEAAAKAGKAAGMSAADTAKAARPEGGRGPRLGGQEVCL